MFLEGKEKSALQRLTKLIQESRTYFVYALIDPDLAPYSAAIDSQLLMLFDAAKESAKSILGEAEKEVERSKELLDVDGVSETQSLLLKTRSMIESGSYFSYLDAIHYGSSIIATCKNRIKERIRKLSERLHQLVGRIEKDVSFVKSYRYPRLIDPHGIDLERVWKNIHQAQDMVKFAPGERLGILESSCEKLSTELTRIEFNLKKLEVVQQILINVVRFLKRSAIFLSIAVLLGIFAVPPVINNLNINLFGLEASAGSNMWYYQRTFLIIGTFVSLGISLLLTIKSILYDD
jgi:hypothetical protein